MINICLYTGLFCFSLFFYLRLRGVFLNFLDNYAKKISRELDDLDSIKLEIEILKNVAVNNLKNLPEEKISLLKEISYATDKLLSRKGKELESLKAAKISAMQNSLDLLHKRKNLEIKKILVLSIRDALLSNLLKENITQNSIEEITKVISKI